MEAALSIRASEIKKPVNPNHQREKKLKKMQKLNEKRILSRIRPIVSYLNDPASDYKVVFTLEHLEREIEVVPTHM